MKKIFILLLMIVPLFAEIKIVYEGIAHNGFFFEKDGVYGYKDSGSVFAADKKIKVKTYKEYFREKCDGRDFDIITANVGMRGHDNFVIDCKGKIDGNNTKGN